MLDLVELEQTTSLPIAGRPLLACMEDRVSGWISLYLFASDEQTLEGQGSRIILHGLLMQTMLVIEGVVWRNLVARGFLRGNFDRGICIYG